jgi:integrase
VPLDGRLREVYDGAMWRAPTGTDRLFPVSDAAMRRLCRQIACKPVTIHGFRSSFRDWRAENGVSRDLAEAALAQAIKDKTEAAYNRTSMVEKRREVMERWATFAHGEISQAT